MLTFECLAVNQSLGELVLKYINYVERSSLVEEVYQLVGNLCDEFTLHPWNNFNAPKFGVYDRGQLNLLFNLFIWSNFELGIVISSGEPFVILCLIFLFQFVNEVLVDPVNFGLQKLDIVNFGIWG